MVNRMPSYNIGSTPQFGKIKLFQELSQCDKKPVYIVDDPHTSSHIGKNIPVPSWASEENGCIPHKATKVANGIVVEYKPIGTLGVGYAKIYIVGKDQQPFSGMKGIWAETHQIWINERKSNPQSPIEVTITKTGEIRDKYGSNVPPFDVLLIFLVIIHGLYSKWKYFPNARSFSEVKFLTTALSTVKYMSKNAGYIEDDIKDLREQIRYRQNEIAELEKKLNVLYEDGANAMNLLEENGVKVSVEGKVEGVEEDDSEYYSMESSLYDYLTGSYITPIRYAGNRHSSDTATSRIPTSLVLM